MERRDQTATSTWPGWLEARLAGSLEAAAGLRNVVVHGYVDVELEILRDVVENRLGDLLGFVDAIRTRATVCR